MPFRSKGRDSVGIFDNGGRRGKGEADAGEQHAATCAKAERPSSNMEDTFFLLVLEVAKLWDLHVQL